MPAATWAKRCIVLNVTLGWKEQNTRLGGGLHTLVCSLSLSICSRLVCSTRQVYVRTNRNAKRLHCEAKIVDLIRCKPGLVRHTCKQTTRLKKFVKLFRTVFHNSLAWEGAAGGTESVHARPRTLIRATTCGPIALRRIRLDPDAQRRRQIERRLAVQVPLILALQVEQQLVRSRVEGALILARRVADELTRRHATLVFGEDDALVLPDQQSLHHGHLGPGADDRTALGLDQTAEVRIDFAERNATALADQLDDTQAHGVEGVVTGRAGGDGPAVTGDDPRPGGFGPDCGMPVGGGRQQLMRRQRHHLVRRNGVGMTGVAEALTRCGVAVVPFPLHGRPGVRAHQELVPPQRGAELAGRQREVGGHLLGEHPDGQIDKFANAALRAVVPGAGPAVGVAARHAVARQQLAPAIKDELALRPQVHSQHGADGEDEAVDVVPQGAGVPGTLRLGPPGTDTFEDGAGVVVGVTPGRTLSLFDRDDATVEGPDEGVRKMSGIGHVASRAIGCWKNKSAQHLTWIWLRMQVKFMTLFIGQFSLLLL